MNAVIVELRKKQAAALDESGRIIRIHNAGYEIGQQIELHEVRPVHSAPVLKRLSTGVAAAVLVAMIGTGTAYAVPYGTVTLDGGSSVEYTINCFDYVIGVKGTNEEGETLLSEIDTRQLRHHRINAAVATTVEHMDQHAPAESLKEELRIRADTGNDLHTDRLREELEPLLERDRPAPSDGDHNPDTPPAEGHTPSANPGQVPGKEESTGSDDMQPNAPATDHGSASDGAAPNDLLTGDMGFSPEGSMPNPEGLPDNREEKEERIFLPDTPEAPQGVEQELLPEMEQAPTMGRGGM